MVRGQRQDMGMLERGPHGGALSDPKDTVVHRPSHGHREVPPRLRLRASLAGAAVASLVGCTAIDSVDIRTNGIQPDMVVRTTNLAATSDVRVSLKVGSSAVDFVELEGTDVLQVSAGNATLEFEEQKALGTTSYAATIPTDAPGTVVTVAFLRGPEDDSAPASTVTLGPRLKMVAPTAGAVFSRASDALALSWENDPSDNTGSSEAAVSVGWSGLCVQSGSRDLPAGETILTLEPGSLLTAPLDGTSAPVPDSCPVTFTLSRRQDGTLDPAFGGGSIRHLATASVEVTSQP